MGKKFVIMELEQIGDHLGGGYKPVGAKPREDATWIDSRHVIDGNRLRYGFPKIGEQMFFVRHGWEAAAESFEHEALILDLPKNEDEWEKWIGDGAAIVGKCTLQFNLSEEFKDWLRRMPRRE